MITRCDLAKLFKVETRGDDFYCRVIFTCENNEAMYGRSRVKVKIEPRSTFTFTRGLSNIGANLFPNVNFTPVR